MIGAVCAFVGQGDEPLASSALADLRARLAALCSELGKVAPKPAEAIPTL